jgi:YhcH/YjgK/YiaL family protein
MIFDKLDRHARYVRPGDALGTAFAYLAANQFADTKPGRIDLDGSALYAMVQEYTTKPVEQGHWEAHRRYVDVQYIVSGRERILFAPIDQLQAGDYVPEKDFLPLTGPGSTLDLTAGFFVVFFPEDAHMPGLAIDLPEPVKKVVAKVAVD